MSAREQARRDAEFDRLLREWAGVRAGFECYKEEAVRKAYEMGKRHGREEGPRWHDAPTCDGCWVSNGLAFDVFDGCKFAKITNASFEPICIAAVRRRWYGPIPADKLKEREQK